MQLHNNAKIEITCAKSLISISACLVRYMRQQNFIVRPSPTPNKNARLRVIEKVNCQFTEKGRKLRPSAIFNIFSMVELKRARS